MNLTSGKLNYTRLSPADLQLYARLVMNDAVMKYITGKALTKDEAEQRFQKAVDTNNTNVEAGFFIVRNKLDETFIGVVKLVELDNNKAEVGYMLVPEHWGQGYASEMVERMIALARENKIAGELIGIVDPENPASIRVLTKFGFKLYDTGQIDGLAAAYYKLKLPDTRKM